MTRNEPFDLEYAQSVAPSDAEPVYRSSVTMLAAAKGETKARKVNEHLDTDVFISPEELMRYLKLGRTKVYELLAQGTIPSYLVGRLRRVKREDVDRWLEAQKQVP
jgi:excisionase family DNA binding protein